MHRTGSCVLGEENDNCCIMFTTLYTNIKYLIIYKLVIAGGSWSANTKRIQGLAEKVWSELKIWPVSRPSLHSTLLLLIEPLMANLAQPSLLTDYLMTALEYGECRTGTVLYCMSAVFMMHVIR